MTKLKTASKILIAGLIAGGVAWGLLQRWPAALQISDPQTCPPIHKMKFGAEILKFLVWDEPGVEPRLHMLMPMPITGMTGKITDLREIQKKVRRGK